MHRYLSTLVLATLMSLGLFGSVPVSAAGTTGGLAPTGVSPVQAAAALLQSYPYYHSAQVQLRQLAGPAFRQCTVQVGGHTAGCPLSSRLTVRLRHPDTRPPVCLGGCTLEPICRCQNPPTSISLRLLDQSKVAAHVAARWNYGPNSFTLTITVRRTFTGWVIDDLYCAGRPSTTVYHHIVPCK